MSDTEPAAAAAPLAVVTTCKLPPFWPEDPETWLEQVEAQFHLRRVTADATKFYHIVAALDPPTARRLRDTIRTAPVGGRYDAIRARLLSTFSLTESDRANRLLNLRGLGDRKPSALMDEMVALLEGHPPCFIFKQLFINQLPESLQVPLATVVFLEARDFALEADKLWSAKVAAEANSPVTINRVGAGVATPRPRPADVTTDGLCWYHAEFGSKATKCRRPCSFSGNGQAGRR